MFSNMLTRKQGLANIAYPYMEKLWKLTDETITLYVKKGYDRLCIAELPSPQPLKYTAGIGVTVPLYAGSPGKLLLAFMPPEERTEALNKIEMLSLTNKTIINRDDLLKELLLIREQGWSTSFGERIEGASSLSVPVFNAEKRVDVSLSILGPFSRLGEEILMGYLDTLREAALSLSNRLGYYEYSEG
jgi:DNA-binding IclR family transcriptional regulator